MLKALLTNRWILALGLTLWLPTTLWAQMSISPEVQKNLDQEITHLVKLAANPTLVVAVKAQNAKKTPLAEVRKMDQQWMEVRKSNAPEPAWMSGLLNNSASEVLRKANIDSQGRYPEAFLTDAQGANVALNKYTSDYWQGDEAKFTKCFGKGQPFIGEPEFDESSKAMQVQVSVPVLDGKKPIGVLVVGVKFSKLK